MFGDPYLSPWPQHKILPRRDHFAALCRISLKTQTPGYTQNLLFFLNLRTATNNRKDAPWCPVGYLKFYLTRTKVLFITTTGSASRIPRTTLSRWIVAFVWRAYERLVIPMPPAHPGISHQVHYLRIVCQTAEYFRDVLVFQGIGNSPAHWTETLVLHFIGVISEQNILKAVFRGWSLRFMSLLVLGRKILECVYRFHTTTSYLHRFRWIQPDIFWGHRHGLPS